jgi:hypothetical protein
MILNNNKNHQAIMFGLFIASEQTPIFRLFMQVNLLTP